MFTEDKLITNTYRIILLIISIISLIFTTGLLDGNINIRIFYMFTTLSNILCAVYYSLKIFKKKNYNLLFYICLTSISLTFIIAGVILKMGWSFESYQSLSFLGLHIIVPLMTIFDYIFFTNKGIIKRNYILYTALFPVIYVVICLIFKIYPYPFLNVPSLGISKVLVNILLIAIFYIIYCYMIYFIDNKLKKK